MPTITTDITEKASFLVVHVNDDLADIAFMIRDQGGRFVVMGADRAARDLVLRLNTGNRGIAVHLPADPSAEFQAGVAECRACWGVDKQVLVLAPAAPA